MPSHRVALEGRFKGYVGACVCAQVRKCVCAVCVWVCVQVRVCSVCDGHKKVKNVNASK